MNRRQFAQNLGVAALGLTLLFVAKTRVPLEPRVWLATDRFGTPNVLHMTGGTYEDPLTMGDMHEAAWKQIDRDEYMQWRTGGRRFFRYSPDGTAL